MLGTSMAHNGWTPGAQPMWHHTDIQQPRGSLYKTNSASQGGLGAIGSERKVGTRTMSGSGSRPNRPPSWQDEIGAAKPKGVPIRPPTVEAISAKSSKSRSSSTPAAEAVKPRPFQHSSQLRHLSMSVSEHDDANESARRTLRLTKSPTEFVPASKNATPRSTVSPVMNKQPYNSQIPSSHWNTSRAANWSPRTAAAYNNYEMTGEIAFDPAMVLSQYPRLPNRETNLRELRDRETPPPRAGSPDNDPEDLAILTDQILSFKPRPTGTPTDRTSLSGDYQALLDSPEAIAAERRRNAELYNMPTPANLEEALRRGIGEYEFLLLQRRDLARRLVPSTTYPFLNNGKDINDTLEEWPLDVQKAISMPPALAKNQFVVVSFKHHRAEVFLLSAQMSFAERLSPGDLVVVQADRGENVGSVWHMADNMMEAERVARDLNTEQLNHLLSFARQFVQQARALAPLQSSYKLSTQPGFIIRKAEDRYGQALMHKEHDETKAKRIAATKAQEMGFPLEILDTEFQIDHQKLTIYYISPEYVRFKELVNNIYKIYKMRIWMSSINPQHPPQDFYFG